MISGVIFVFGALWANDIRFNIYFLFFNEKLLIFSCNLSNFLK